MASPHPREEPAIASPPPPRVPHDFRIAADRGPPRPDEPPRPCFLQRESRPPTTDVRAKKTSTTCRISAHRPGPPQKRTVPSSPSRLTPAPRVEDGGGRLHLHEKEVAIRPRRGHALQLVQKCVVSFTRNRATHAHSGVADPVRWRASGGGHVRHRLRTSVRRLPLGMTSLRVPQDHVLLARLLALKVTDGVDTVGHRSNSQRFARRRLADTNIRIVPAVSR
jgi:hypothetical protein